MKRRDFLKAATVGLLGWGVTPAEALSQLARLTPQGTAADYDAYIKDYLIKMRNFNQHHTGDICLNQAERDVLRSAVRRLRRLCALVGYGNFHLLGFDEALLYARNYAHIGDFSRQEIDFLETIFYHDASRYGFLGEKPLKKITDDVRRTAVIKVQETGNYVYRGLPLETYHKIKKALGDQVVMTSGVRSVMKQFMLFLNKAYLYKGNLSLASRQLAPPGYSFHGVADFDVGQAGFGAANFTERFIATEVYRKLVDLGFLTLRYPRDNMLGVRFEPWHIKVNVSV